MQTIKYVQNYRCLGKVCKSLYAHQTISNIQTKHSETFPISCIMYTKNE